MDRQGGKRRVEYGHKYVASTALKEGWGAATTFVSGEMGDFPERVLIFHTSIVPERRAARAHAYEFCF